MRTLVTQRHAPLLLYYVIVNPHDITNPSTIYRVLLI